MHEVGIAYQAVETAIEYAKKAGATKITLIKLRIGAASGVVPDALEFAFEAVTRGNMAEGSKLEWDLVPVKCYCKGCEIEFTPEGFIYECPQCKEPSWDVRNGKELDLMSVEAE